MYVSVVSKVARDDRAVKAHETIVLCICSALKERETIELGTTVTMVRLEYHIAIGAPETPLLSRETIRRGPLKSRKTIRRAARYRLVRLYVVGCN